MADLDAPTPAPRAAGRLPGERTDYLAGTLADSAPADPMELFDAWLADAFARREGSGDLSEPAAVVLSTVEVTAAGPRPRSRTLLLKGHDARGFVVYTNLRSAKGRQALTTPAASLLFPWYALQRQVRVDGAVERVEDAQADEYFASRPRESQVAAWASQQSEAVADRETLDAVYAQAQARFAGREVPRPPHWGGLRVVPDRVEFWQGRAHRLHDRIVYDLVEGSPGSWQRTRLAP